jgi:hypothetical protein
MFEDAARDALVLNHRYESHRAGAPRTSENVDRVRALHEDSPREPTLATGIIGRYDVITPRTNAMLHAGRTFVRAQPTVGYVARARVLRSKLAAAAR